jgi:hypothetical protein
MAESVRSAPQFVAAFVADRIRSSRSISSAHCRQSASTVSLLIPNSNDGLILIGIPLLRPYARLAFRYVSPAQRHAGQDQAILAARHALYARLNSSIRRAGQAAPGAGRPSARWPSTQSVRSSSTRQPAPKILRRKLRDSGDNQIDARSVREHVRGICHRQAGPSFPAISHCLWCATGLNASPDAVKPTSTLFAARLSRR